MRRLVPSLAALAASLALGALSAPLRAADDGVSKIDDAMKNYVTLNAIPAASIAVARKGKLVFEQAYGHRDKDKKVATAVSDRFRIASISKPFTAAAIVKLIEEKKISLKTKVFDEIRPKAKNPKLHGMAVKSADERLDTITVDDLLHHVGGFDPGVKGWDPMFHDVEIAKAFGRNVPIDREDVLEFMYSQKLDHDPEKNYAYSNFGYLALGFLIEKASGMPYEDFVLKNVLHPAGITDMHLGHSLHPAAEEVHYWQDGGEAPSVFDAKQPLVPWPYGGFNIENMAPHGGWTATAKDLVRFAVALGHEDGRQIVKEPLTYFTVKPDPYPAGEPDFGWYGRGWVVGPMHGDKPKIWHNGSLPGTNTWLARRTWDDVVYAILLDKRFADDRDGKVCDGVDAAIDQVKTWPAGNDLFDKPK